MRTFLITALLAGVASCGARANATDPAPLNRPDPAAGGYRAPQPRVEGWVRLGTAVETGPLQRTVDVRGTGGRISNLLIKATHGEPEISQITIRYMDGTEKMVRLDRTFLPGDAQVIELREDRPVDKIIVFVDPDAQGSFDLFGA